MLRQATAKGSVEYVGYLTWTRTVSGPSLKTTCIKVLKRLAMEGGYKRAGKRQGSNSQSDFLYFTKSECGTTRSRSCMLLGLVLIHSPYGHALTLYT